MKALFFDIDGTLVNKEGQLPDSARKALDQARAKGHKLFLCTGRNEVQIYSFLKDYGFDGVVSAAGAMVSCEGKEIYHNFIGEEPLNRCIDFFAGRPVIFGLQAASGNYMDKKSYQIFEDVAEKYHLDERVLKAVTNGMEIVDSLRGHRDVEKMFYFECPESVEQVQQALGEELLVLEGSLPIPGSVSGAGEITKRGVKKATGMEHAIRYFGIGQEDTVAFGDGANDIDMLEYAAVGVAMGNAKDAVKAAADLVTDDIDADGLAHGMERLGLTS